MNSFKNGLKEYLRDIFYRLLTKKTWMRIKYQFRFVSIFLNIQSILDLSYLPIPDHSYQ